MTHFCGANWKSPKEETAAALCELKIILLINSKDYNVQHWKRQDCFCLIFIRRTEADRSGTSQSINIT